MPTNTTEDCVRPAPGEPGVFLSGPLALPGEEVESVEQILPLLGCEYVEQVPTRFRDLVLLVDEEALLKTPRPPANRLAGMLAGRPVYGEVFLALVYYDEEEELCLGAIGAESAQREMLRELAQQLAEMGF